MTGRGRGARPGFGVYLHIPFCASRCDYSAFATWTDKSDLIDRYVAAVATEIGRAKSSGILGPADSVFFGGGTPSLIGAGPLSFLLESIERDKSAEVTVECNPESTTAELLEGLRSAGVNRLSLGVQSLSDRVLAALGRQHDRSVIERALVVIADAGITNFNVDLIYGARGETDADWLATVRGVLDLDPRPTHISAYALTVEAGTPLARDRARHPDDDVQAARYEIAAELFETAGYEWYELSNWALPGYRCRHNESCWQQGDYLGFGCSAHSHLSGHRFANVFSIERYLARIEAGQSASASEERLDDEGRALEALELLLRTSAGVPIGALDLEDEELSGLLEVAGGQMRLTRRGRLLANEVAIRLCTPVFPAS